MLGSEVAVDGNGGRETCGTSGMLGSGGSAALILGLGNGGTLLFGNEGNGGIPVGLSKLGLVGMLI